MATKMPPMRYVNLGKSGLRVSPICVGCMSFSDRRGRMSWTLEEKDALPILSTCYNSGLNFYDTANGYGNGTSEEILGHAIRTLGWRRENLVIATKVWAPVGRRENGIFEDPLKMDIPEREAKGYVNGFGLSRKVIFDSVDASLRRLGLEYIDLLQIHRFDPYTPVTETMEALHDVVKSGKVRYIGASSMMAHELLEMQYTAKMRGWTEFISMQNLFNATYREEEREMIPALGKFGMGMIPWSPVAMGFLTRPHKSFEEGSERGVSMGGAFLGNKMTEADRRINECIEEIARERDTTMAVVALAWCLSKPFLTAPIVGMSKVERVEEAVRAIHFKLEEEEIRRIDELYEPRNVMGIAVQRPRS